MDEEIILDDLYKLAEKKDRDGFGNNIEEFELMFNAVNEKTDLQKNQFELLNYVFIKNMLDQNIVFELNIRTTSGHESEYGDQFEYDQVLFFKAKPKDIINYIKNMRVKLFKYSFEKVNNKPIFSISTLKESTSLHFSKNRALILNYFNLKKGKYYNYHNFFEFLKNSKQKMTKEITSDNFNKDIKDINKKFLQHFPDIKKEIIIKGNNLRKEPNLYRWNGE